MPLRRDTVTRASRVMLPAHAAFSSLLGATWCFQADARTITPAMGALRDVWSIQSTGGVLAAIGVSILVALVVGSRVLVGVALGAGMAAFLLLAVAMTVSAISFGGSLSAPLWPLYLATAHLASLISVALDEGNPEAQ